MIIVTVKLSKSKVLTFLFLIMSAFVFNEFAAALDIAQIGTTKTYKGTSKLLGVCKMKHRRAERFITAIQKAFPTKVHAVVSNIVQVTQNCPRNRVNQERRRLKDDYKLNASFVFTVTTTFTRDVDVDLCQVEIEMETNILESMKIHSMNKLSEIFVRPFPVSTDQIYKLLQEM